MENYPETTSKDLPYIFQLLESEDKVVDSILSLEDDMNQIDKQKRKLNVDLFKQSHMVRDIVLSIVLGTVFALLFHFSFFIGFIIGLIIFIGYDYYKKNTIKDSIKDSDLQIQKIAAKKNSVQDKLNDLVQKNSQYTNMIPEKFRDADSVLMLFNYLYYGQADTMKEAYNLLDLEYKHQEEMGVLKENSQLLKENNQVAYQQLSKLQGLTEAQEAQLNSIQELSVTAHEANLNLKHSDNRLRGLEDRFVPEYKRRN